MAYPSEQAQSECLTSGAPCQWFAVYTVPRHEKRVAHLLNMRQVENYLPTYRSSRQWKNGTRPEIELPLFPNYLFIHIVRENRGHVLATPGVVTIVGRGMDPDPLPDFEIESLRTGLHLRKVEPHPYLTVGRRVRIKSGAMCGLEGVLVRRKNCDRVVITLDCIRQSMAVEVAAEELELVAQTAAASSHA